jgi:hypothetical protein
LTFATIASAPAVLRAASLRPPADLEERRILARALGRESSPKDLDQLFAWHDGERETAFLENSADLGGWRLLSTSEALALMRDAQKWPLWRFSGFIEAHGAIASVVFTDEPR